MSYLWQGDQRWPSNELRWATQTLTRLYRIHNKWASWMHEHLLHFSFKIILNSDMNSWLCLRDLSGVAYGNGIFPHIILNLTFRLTILTFSGPSSAMIPATREPWLPISLRKSSLVDKAKSFSEKKNQRISMQTISYNSFLLPLKMRRIFLQYMEIKFYSLIGSK